MYACVRSLAETIRGCGRQAKCECDEQADAETYRVAFRRPLGLLPLPRFCGQRKVEPSGKANRGNFQAAHVVLRDELSRHAVLEFAVKLSVQPDEELVLLNANAQVALGVHLERTDRQMHLRSPRAALHRVQHDRLRAEACAEA